MHIKCLEYVVYGPNGRGWKAEKVRHPAWDDIERAIRRLDRFHYPFAFLWATEDESQQVIDGTGELLEVVGGEGVWWLAGSFDGSFQRRLDDPELGEEEVAVWTSDQGFADAERHICRDVEAVIRAARYYAEHGGFDPALSWEKSSS
jgi:hypothetical protein